jgi:hypothetical protein
MPGDQNAGMEENARNGSIVELFGPCRYGKGGTWAMVTLGEGG